MPGVARSLPFRFPLGRPLIGWDGLPAANRRGSGTLRPSDQGPLFFESVCTMYDVCTEYADSVLRTPYIRVPWAVQEHVVRIEAHTERAWRGTPPLISPVQPLNGRDGTRRRDILALDGGH